MASTIKIKRSAVTGNAPNTSNITTGELALNTADGVLYSSDGSSIFEIGANLSSLSVSGISYPTSDGTNGQVLTTNGSGTLSFTTVSGGGGGGASVTTSNTAPSSPSDGDLWWDTDDGELNLWDDSANTWIAVSSDPGAYSINGLSDGYSDGYSIGLGTNALADDDGTNNSNVAIGYNAASNLTSGTANIAIGNYAIGTGVTTGNDNIALGNYAGADLTSGQYNIFQGYQAGSNVTTGTTNVAIGYYAMGIGVTTSSDNIVLGNYAGADLTSGGYNIFQGYQAGYNATIATYNIGLGRQALGSGIVTGSHNIALGYRSGYFLTSGGYNIGIGYWAAYGATTGNHNIGIGYSADFAVSSGQHNIGIGYGAGGNITTGSYNVAIGAGATASAVDVEYEITLGSTSHTKFRMPGVQASASDGDILTYNSSTGYLELQTLTASDILTKIKTVDGATSGLDADLLDGQEGSYYLDWGNVTNKPDPIITLAGDLSGSVTLTDLASGTLTATIVADSVALGTDTTGDYVASLVAGTGVTLTNNSGESATPTIAIGQSVGTTDNVTFNNVTVSGTLTSDDITSTNISIAGNATITGNLTVSGTTTTVNSNTVAIGDSIITLNSDETGTPSQDGGIEIERGTSTNVSWIWDETNDRWTSGSEAIYTTGAISGASLTTTGNINVGGTVDGRDVATDGTKLDGIESGATADQTASEILTALLTVDGSGTGLDADLWDGNQFASYLDQAVLTSSSPSFAGLTVDTSTLYVDATNNRVGIGTTSPGGILSVALSTGHSVGGNWTNTAAVFGTGTSTGGGIGLAYDDTNGGSIHSIVPGVAWKPIEFYSSELIFNTSGSIERMRITSAGKVGIGTTSPTSILTISSSENQLGIIESDGTSTHSMASINIDSDILRFQTRNSSGTFVSQDYQIPKGSSGATGHWWYIGGSEAMRINSSGRVGIGTTAPTKTLHVVGDMLLEDTSPVLQIKDSNGTGSATVGYVEFLDSTDARLGYVGFGSGSNNDLTINSDYADGEVRFTTGGTTERMRIDSSGNVGIGTSSPSYKLEVSGSLNTTSFYIGGTQVTSTATELNLLDGITGTVWSSGNDGSGSGLDADTLDGVEGSSFLRSDTSDTFSGTLTLDGLLVGGIGATTTSGTTNWNDSTNARSGSGYTLLLGNATNGPGVGGYYHPFSFEYSSKNGNGNMTQFAIPYSADAYTDGPYFRTRYSGTWSNWYEMWHSGNDGSGSGLDADTVDGYHSTSFPIKGSLTDNTSSNITTFTSGAAIDTASGNQSGLQVYQSTVGNDAFMTFHVSNDIAVHFGLDGGINDLAVGGWSFGTNSFRIWHENNDGSGSGLDADTLDGVQGASYLRSDAADTATGQITINDNGPDPLILQRSSQVGIQFNDTSVGARYLGVNGGNLLFGTNLNHSLNNRVLTTADEGAGNGLDADTLDGVQGASYLRSDVDDTFTNLTGTSIRLGTGYEINNTGNSHEFTTPWGYIQLGPVNTSFAHISTDRTKFYFNKRVLVNEGIIASYNSDLTLTADDTNFSAAITILETNNNVGIGTTAPESLLTVDGQVVIGDLVNGSSNLTNFLSGTPPQLIAGWSVPAVTWTPSAITEAVFTRDGDMAIDILAGSGSSSVIHFSDNDDEDVGMIKYNHSSNYLQINVNASEAMRIDSSGKVGIGKTDPDIYGKLVVFGGKAGTADSSAAFGTPGSAQGEDADIALYGTFEGTTDNGPRRTADIVAGYDGGAWGYEYLSFNVGYNGNASNDTRILTQEKVRIVANGNVGINTTTPTNAKLDVYADSNQRGLHVRVDDTIGDQTLFASYIDYNISGSDTLTATRPHTGLVIDVDSSATGGDTTNEHRVTGLNINTAVTGDSDNVFGIYTASVANQSSATGIVSNIYGIYSLAQAINTGNVTTVYGAYNYALSNYYAKSISSAFGSYNRFYKYAADTGTTTNAYGSYNQITAASGAGAMTNAYATRSYITDISSSSAHLFYGNYGTKTNITTAWGVYITNEDKNYFSGNVGIGVPSPAEMLSVSGNITATGDITAYYSDERLKTFDGKIPNAIEKINSLNGYYFYENEIAKDLGYNNPNRQVGLSAQEVEKVLPEVVAKAPINAERGTDYKTLKYDRMVPLLIEAIKEQQQQIEEQKKQIEELKSLIERMLK